MYIYTCPLVTRHLANLGITRCLLPIGGDGYALHSMELYSAPSILLNSGVPRSHSFTRRNFSVTPPLLGRFSRSLLFYSARLPRYFILWVLARLGPIQWAYLVSGPKTKSLFLGPVNYRTRATANKGNKLNKGESYLLSI